MSHKPGFAESLGVLKTAFDVESNTTTIATQKALIQHPSMANLRAALDSTWAATKDNSAPAIVGLVVSNVEVIPVFGKLARPVKRRADRLLKKWVGMRL